MLPMETQQQVWVRALGAATTNAAKEIQACITKMWVLIPKNFSIQFGIPCIMSPARTIHGNCGFETLASVHDFAALSSSAVCERALGAATTNPAEGNQASTKKHVGINAQTLCSEVLYNSAYMHYVASKDYSPHILLMRGQEAWQNPANTGLHCIALSPARRRFCILLKHAPAE